MVVGELRGEKIDIIPWNDEPARFIAKALSPARVREVLVDDEARQATVIVPDDNLALAIGREGQNARLAAKLTGWRIDIRSATEFSDDEQTQGASGLTEEAGEGRCHAVMKNGKTCPNAAEPDSIYCSLPHHQALAHAAPAAELPEEDAADESVDTAGPVVKVSLADSVSDAEGEAVFVDADDAVSTEKTGDEIETTEVDDDA